MIELAASDAFQTSMQRFFLAATTALSIAALTPLAAADEYVVRLSDDLRTLTARVCFTAAPAELRAGDTIAARYLIDARWESGATVQRARGDRLRLQPAATPDCLVYRVDTGAAADDRALRRSGFVGADLVVTPEIWLWRPNTAITLRLDLPQSLRASLPWPRVANSDQPWHYRITDVPRTWAAQSAFGQLTLKTIDLAGGRLDVAIADAANVNDIDTILTWLRTTAGAMTTVYGQFPQQRTQVLVIPGDHASPVPWGQVLRGGAPSVNFYIDRDATLDELLGDWTAFHEFSHLFLPFVRRYEAYLSEGFASYFQNVTRARSSNLTEREAWANLWRGFERGRDAGGTGTLARAARRMGRDHNYMRVYWSGAALALQADIALRRKFTDQDGLGHMLGELNDCCRTDNEAWSGAQLCATLDRLGDGQIFSKLHDDMASSKRFPDIFPLLRKLGVRERDGEIVLDDDAPLSGVRQAITQRAQSNVSGRAASQ